MNRGKKKDSKPHSVALRISDIQYQFLTNQVEGSKQKLSGYIRHLIDTDMERRHGA